MTFILLAGGYGTRLRCVVKDVPKPMAPIQGRPFLEILLSNLVCFSPDKIIICVSWLGNMIIDYFGDTFHGVPIMYSNEPMPLGTGGAIWKTFRDFSLSNAIIFNADTFTDINITDFDLQCKHSPFAIALARMRDCSHYGQVVIKNDRITAFIEKGPNLGTGLINAGIYKVDKSILCPMPETFSFEKDFLRTRIAGLNHAYYISTGYFIDIGRPETYHLACSDNLPSRSFLITDNESA